MKINMDVLRALVIDYLAEEPAGTAERLLADFPAPPAP